MSRDSILKLISSSALTEEQLSKELIRILKKDPELAGGYLKERTIFHILILKNKLDTLEILLNSDLLEVKNIESIVLQEYLSEKQNLLHFAIIHSNESAFEIIYKKFPFLLNQVDSNNNTPLHIAVIHKQFWAIRSIRNIQPNFIYPHNNDDCTVLDLAKNDKELQNALLGYDLNEINPIYALSNPDKITLSLEFPHFFKTYLEEYHSPRSLDGKKKKPKKLTSPRKTDVRSKLSSDKSISVNEPTPFNQTIQLTMPGHIQLPNKSYKELISNFLSRNLHLLIRDNELENPVLIPPDTYPPRVKSCEQIVEFINSKPHLNNFNTIDFVTFYQQIFGLISILPLTDLLINLRKLYPFFNVSQKILSNMILFLSFPYFSSEFATPSLLNMHLRFFLKSNIHPEKGLGEIGQEINDDFEYLFYSYQVIHSPSVQELSSSSTQFSELIETAISKKSSQRLEQVQIIAKELKKLTLNLYYHVSLQELMEPPLEEPLSKESRSYILRHTHYFNALNNYFLSIIMKQPTDNIKNTYLFFIELAIALMNQKPDDWIDLHHMILIYNVINTEILIVHLSKYLSNFTPQEYDMISELKQMMDIRGNFKWARKMAQTYEKCLPYLGMIQADLIFATEGNKEFITLLKITGRILHHIIHVKSVQVDLLHQSNLPDFLDAYKMIEEHTLIETALRLQQPENHVFAVPRLTEDPLSLLKNLEVNYLARNLIPRLKIEAKEYSLFEFIFKLIEWFGTLVINYHWENNESLYHQFNAIIDSLLNIHNTYYYPQIAKDVYIPEIAKYQVNKFFPSLSMVKLQAALEIDNVAEHLVESKL
ncbi:MAG: RasGEF domain-containing protein [Legionella sp.]|nr:RasGEF domain-containing protein [Legionella sp.]